MAKNKNTDKANVIDFASFKADDAEYDEIRSTRTRESKYANSPLRDDVLHSYENDKTKKYPAVPNDQVNALVRELRGVARNIETEDEGGNVTIGIGLRVKVVPNEDNATSAVVFLGKERRGSASETEAETVDTPAAENTSELVNA